MILADQKGGLDAKVATPLKNLFIRLSDWEIKDCEIL